MAEAAGLVLSAVALFGSCIKGYRIISSVKSLNRDSAVLSCRLEIEEKRFLLWGRNSGLAQSTCLIPAHDLSTIINVLTEIKLLTQDAKELKKRYEIQVEDIDETSLPADPEEFLNSSIVFAKARQQINKRASSRPRPAWKKAVRWLFEKDGFAKLVLDLKTLNDGLNALLQESQLTGFRNQFTAMCLESCSTDDRGRLGVIRDATADSYPEFSRITDQRMYTLEIESLEPYSASTDPIPITELQLLPQEYIDRPQYKSFAQWKGQYVMAEWRTYDPSSLPPAGKDILERRCQDLSQLLGRKPKPQDFHTLDCIGYCSDAISAKLGLIFSIPQSTLGESLQFQSLSDVLELSRKGGPLPSLVERFALCGLLARSMMHFHAAGWLHRNFNSSCVSFFGLAKDGLCLPPPVISGFAFSRPSAIGEYSASTELTTSEMLHQHPDLAANPRHGYKREFDIYSLGIVLVEIGFWKPVSSFHKSKYDPKQNLERLLKNQLDGDLAHRMGRRFEDAVKLCLVGAPASEHMMSEKEQLLAFFEKVVLQIDIKCLTGESDTTLYPENISAYDDPQISDMI